jgi:hypothetical protein
MLQNLLVHYIVPIAVILDWILFDEKSVYRWFDPIIWISLPVAYFIFTIVRANIGGRIEIIESSYPYFFIDVDILGWVSVLKNIGLLILGFLVLGYLIFLIDNISFKRTANKKAHRMQLLNRFYL